MQAAIRDLLRHVLCLLACSALASCGGGSVAIEVLPSSVTIRIDSRVDAGVPLVLDTDLGSGHPDWIFRWTFSDGSSASGPNPTHVFAETGSFEVVLTVDDGKGHTVTARIVVQVVRRGLGQEPTTGGADAVTARVDDAAPGSGR